MCLAEQRFRHHRHAKAPLPGLDHGAQSRPAGTDDDDVVLVPFDLYFYFCFMRSHQPSLVLDQ